MWHELVLNGIGGHTIAEAQERISAAEFGRWVAYRKKRGSLHPGLRAEAAVATLSALTANLHRKKDAPAFSFYAFAPHHDEPKLSLAEAMQNWK